MDLTEIKNTLELLKSKIEKASTSIAECKGQEKELLKRLKSEFGVNSIEDAEKMLNTLEKEKSKVSSKIEKQFKKLKENCDWIEG